MKQTLTNRHSPLPLNHSKTLKNRVVVPPMASETADDRGFVTQETIAHYGRLAKSKAALIMVEYSFVHPTGKSEERQLGISEDSQIPGLAQVAEEIHLHGALAAIQLTHAGGKTEKKFSAGIMQSPSGIIVPVKDQLLESPAVMTLEEIQGWKDSFKAAALRAVAAGFDLVELHAAHGYGLNQWLSPITNQRTDHYGGSLTKNLKLLIEIISEIKTACPGLLLSVRIPGQDFLEGGLSPEAAVTIAKTLEENGVDLINVSSGIGGWRRPRSRTGEGYLVDEASFIARQIRTPVIGVGGIESGDYIDNILGDNRIALAAVGRAILHATKENHLCLK